MRFLRRCRHQPTLITDRGVAGRCEHCCSLERALPVLRDRPLDTENQSVTAIDSAEKGLVSCVSLVRMLVGNRTKQKHGGETQEFSQEGVEQ